MTELELGPVFIDAVNVEVDRVGVLAMTLFTFPSLIDH
jgi:hypothetical protein